MPLPQKRQELDPPAPLGSQRASLLALSGSMWGTGGMAGWQRALKRWSGVKEQ